MLENIRDGREAMLIEMRNLNCEFPANGTTWERSSLGFHYCQFSIIIRLLERSSSCGNRSHFRRWKRSQFPTAKSSP